MKLFRISNFLSFAAAAIMAVLLFWTSQDVQKKEDILGDLKQELSHENESFRVLSVEWDYLNRPQRLEKIANEQLGMELPEFGGVVKSIEQIPEPQIVDMEYEYPSEGAGIIPVSQETKKPEVKKPDIISPSTTEKQSFDRLIESLDSGQGDTP